jgi:hypothetical protein
MSAKEVKFSVDARDRMLHGIDTLTHAVRVTLGPKGRNVLLDKSFGGKRRPRARPPPLIEASEFRVARQGGPAASPN